MVSYNNLSIDVVIPSYNFNEELVERIKKINIPEGVTTKYFIVIDNPKLERPEIEGFELIQNKENQGAHISRNIGIEAGGSEWILFLDDDVEPEPNLIEEYCNEIAKRKLPGYIGKTTFPNPCNSFTKSVLDSDILTFFPIAETREQVHWGVTANMLVNRKAMGEIRFDDKFPKAGGGEDIDFCLKICKSEGNLFATAPKANVNHGWWNNGAFSLKRFARWAYGDSRLTQIHPELKYYNFPNVAEALFLGFLITILAYNLEFLEIEMLLLIPAAILFGEVFGEFIKLGFTKRWSVFNSILVVFIRAANDLGRLYGNLSRGRLNGFFERFDYFCTGESIDYERKIGFFKMMMHLLAVIVVIAINP